MLASLPLEDFSWAHRDFLEMVSDPIAHQLWPIRLCPILPMVGLDQVAIHFGANGGAFFGNEAIGWILFSWKRKLLFARLPWEFHATNWKLRVNLIAL